MRWCCRPDLVVVYTGHNEFYGLYGTGRHQRLEYFLRQLHLTHLVDGLLGSIGAKDEPTDLIKMAAVLGEVPLHGSGRATAEQNLRDNLRRVSRLCKRAQVPLVLCTIVANDAGFAPVGSTEGDEAWKARVEQAAQVLTRGYVAPEDAEGALQQLEQAAALSDEHAWLWYLQGRALERLGRDAEAQRAFREARDLDTMPWRAPTAHNAVIRAVAAETMAVLADVEAAFAEAAPAQGVGWEWMVDHVHFSVAGQALLARTVLHSVATLQDIDLGLFAERGGVSARFGRSAGGARGGVQQDGGDARASAFAPIQWAQCALSQATGGYGRAAAVAGGTARR